VTPRAILVCDLLSCASEVSPVSRTLGDIHDTYTSRCLSQMMCRLVSAAAFAAVEAQQFAFVAVAWTCAKIVDCQKAPMLHLL